MAWQLNDIAPVSMGLGFATPATPWENQPSFFWYAMPAGGAPPAGLPPQLMSMGVGQ